MNQTYLPATALVANHNGLVNQTFFLQQLWCQSHGLVNQTSSGKALVYHNGLVNQTYIRQHLVVNPNPGLAVD